MGFHRQDMLFRGLETRKNFQCGWQLKLNQYGHVSPANASKVPNSHTNYLSVINFSHFKVVVEAINEYLFAIISAHDLPTHCQQVTDR